MAEEMNIPELANETYDIFLCTRELPDALTPETAALRQLCAALIGSGYRVFFPPSTLFGQEPEAKARAIAEAVKTTPVMIAAAVGDEGIQDETARFLWSKFRSLAGEDPSRTFLSCCRDAAELPEELAGQEVMDLGDLEFLVKLKDKLAAALPGVVRAAAEEAPAEEEEAPAEETPAEEAPAEPEAAPEAEPPAEPEVAPEEEPPAETETAPLSKKRRRFWIALAAAAVVVVILVIALCLK